MALVKNRALLAPNGLQELHDGRRGEVAGEHDAIVDRDAVVVDGHAQLAGRRDDRYRPSRAASAPA